MPDLIMENDRFNYGKKGLRRGAEENAGTLLHFLFDFSVYLKVHQSKVN